MCMSDKIGQKATKIRPFYIQLDNMRVKVDEKTSPEMMKRIDEAVKKTGNPYAKLSASVKI